MVKGKSNMKIFYLTFFITIVCAQNSNSFMQATAALNAGMFEEALIHIIEAEKEDPANPNVYQMKALLHEALSQPKEALEAWKNCLKSYGLWPGAFVVPKNPVVVRIFLAERISIFRICMLCDFLGFTICSFP